MVLWLGWETADQSGERIAGSDQIKKRRHVEIKDFLILFLGCGHTRINKVKVCLGRRLDIRKGRFERWQDQ